MISKTARRAGLVAGIALLPPWPSVLPSTPRRPTPRSSLTPSSRPSTRTRDTTGTRARPSIDG
ncbi:hypothetical protein [Saccharopolyspora sp. NPDC002376]